MIFDTARNASNVRWRKSLAELNAVVVGVEFRNEGLSEGHQPFPAGLDDCAAAVRWVHENRDELQISSIIVIGESGGGNLAISTALKASSEGWGARLTVSTQWRRCCMASMTRRLRVCCPGTRTSG